ncbi:MAG: hypothetical protein L0L10_02470 [Tetragenococcus sp.]|nr:hypothetical protein [Tetragenococcus sp.]
MADDKKEQSKEEVYAQRQNDSKEKNEKIFKKAHQEAAENDVVDSEKIDKQELEEDEKE